MANQHLAKSKRICQVEECDNVHYGNGYCHKHYMQIRRNGKPLKRTIYDPNEIIIKNDHAEVVLYDKDGFEITRTDIDIEDVDKISCYKWCLSQGYPKSGTSGLFMHNVIMGCKGIDHVDRNTLNNRKYNLRKCNQSQNIANSKIPIHNTSNFKGAYFNKGRGVWQSYITKNKKHIYLGAFKTRKEAALAYNNAAKKYHGEFAALNEVSP